MIWKKRRLPISGPAISLYCGGKVVVTHFRNVASSVIKLQAPFERLKLANESSEVALCRAIILQAIVDASNNSPSSAAVQCEKAAWDWLFEESPHLSEICMGAELEVDFVRDIATKMISLNKNKQLKC